MKRNTGKTPPRLSLCLVLCCAAGVLGQEAPDKNAIPRASPPRIAESPRYAQFNINNLTSWMRSDGLSNRSPMRLEGARFPRGTASVIYQDGLAWGGLAYADSARTIPAPFASYFQKPARVGGALYVSNCLPGRVTGSGAHASATDPQAAEARVYRIRRDYFFINAKEYRAEAALYFEIEPEEVTPAHVQSLRDQYDKDWREWPAAFGAPFIDRNGNGRYDPPPAFSSDFSPEDLLAGNYDEPGEAAITAGAPANQVLWTVCNDLDTLTAKLLAESLPLGLEAQITQWGYRSRNALGNAFFRRLLLINKGGVAVDAQGNKGAFWIDSMFVAQFSDPDVGDFLDDVMGCDTLLNLAYAYNGNDVDVDFEKFRLPPPAVGYVLLQGPRTPSPADSALWRDRVIPGWKNLPMTGFIFEEPCPICDPIYNVLRFYPLVAGRRYGMTLAPFPPGMTPNTFPLSGDPVLGTGFLDGLGTNYSRAPGDRRFFMSSGPFMLAPGDSQEIVLAGVAALGADHISSVAALKFAAHQIRRWHPYHGHFAQGENTEFLPTPDPPQYFTLSQNYPNPMREETRIDYTVPRASQVQLAIYDLNGRLVRVLENARKQPGQYQARWDGRDENGATAAAGIYFCRFQTDMHTLARKVFLIR